MNYLDDMTEDGDGTTGRRKSKFNKEFFCKKNKLLRKVNGSYYGPHTYVSGQCTGCGKIDPDTKHKFYAAK